MQQKEFEVNFRAVLPPDTGVSSLVIENTVISKINFHGIRFKGRISGDQAEPNNQFLSGIVSLMCIPNDQIAIPTLLSEADLNDSNSFIIACECWSLAVPSGSVSLGYSGVYDFDFAPKTSRTCMKGGKLVGQVTVNSPIADAIITTQLSTFESI